MLFSQILLYHADKYWLCISLSHLFSFCGDSPAALICRLPSVQTPPSYVPRALTDNSDHMMFLQHVENLLLKSSESFLCNFASLPFELLASDVLHRPVTMKELLSHGFIWPKRVDFVFEYPMPLMPNIVFIGGRNFGKKKPLSQVSDFLYEVC